MESITPSKRVSRPVPARRRETRCSVICRMTLTPWRSGSRSRSGCRTWNRGGTTRWRRWNEAICCPPRHGTLTSGRGIETVRGWRILGRESALVGWVGRRSTWAKRCSIGRSKRIGNRGRATTAGRTRRLRLGSRSGLHRRACRAQYLAALAGRARVVRILRRPGGLHRHKNWSVYVNPTRRSLRSTTSACACCRSRLWWRTRGLQGLT